MLDIEIDRATVEEMEQEAYKQALGYTQAVEEGSLCQDMG